MNKLKLSDFSDRNDIAIKRTELSEEYNKIVDQITEQKRDISQDEQKRLDEIIANKKNLEGFDKILTGKEDVMRREAREKAPAKKEEWFDAKTNKPVKVYSRGESFTRDFEPHQRDLSLGRLIQSHILGNSRLAEAERREAEFFGMTTDALSAGVAVPHQLWGNILDLARPFSIVLRTTAQTAIMESNKMTIAKFTADPSFTVKEELAAWEIQPVPMAPIELTAYTIGTVIRSSRELAADSKNYVKAIELALAQALARQIDYYFLFGSGNDQPKGITETTGVNEITATGHLSYEHLIQAWTGITFNNGNPNAFFANPRDLAALALGSRSDLGFIQHPDILKGIEFYHSSGLPATFGGSPGVLSKAIMGDWSSLLIGLRNSVEIEISTTSGEAFKRHAVDIKIWWRGDCAVLHPGHFSVIEDLELYVPPVVEG